MRRRMALIAAASVAAVVFGSTPAFGNAAPALGAEASSTPSTSATADSPGIASVTVADDTVTVSGSVGTTHAGQSVTITVSGAQSSADPADVQTFGTAAAGADGSFDVTATRVLADGTDGLYGEYQAQVAGSTIGDVHFADDLTLHPADTTPYPDVPDKKGLQVQMSDDAEDLGVQHAAINVDLGAIMLAKKTHDDDIAFASGGQTYYFDASAVSALDTQIKPLSDNGTLVNLIVLVYRHPGDADSAANILIHPDASTEAGAGPVFAFNTATEQGVQYLTAAMEFIASRWSQTDQAHGRAVGFIVGNEVNSPWPWANEGDKTLDQFLNDYSRALRIMSLASRKYEQNARTYTSLDHSWTVPSGTNPDPANPTRYFAAKDVVDKLNAISKATGDFPWFIAFHPYPQDLFKPDFWNDTDATDGVDTKLITFKNIQVLPQYLAASDLQYRGEPRRIILSEQGCNTPGNGDALTLDAEKLQAACFAYAYYKIRFLPSIDAFILHRHVDHRQEGGLNLGLWAADYSGDNPNAPLRHKYIYDVYKYIDTSRSLQVTNFAKAIIGIRDWSDVIDGFDPAALDQRTIPTTVGSRLDGKAVHTKSIGSFRSGTDGWIPSDNVASAAAQNDALHVVDQPSTYAEQWRGIAKSFDAAHRFAARGWLTATVSVPKSSALGTEVVARITAETSSGRTVDGQARVAADGKRHTVSIAFPSGFAKDTVTRMQVRVRGTGTTQPTTSFDVDSIGTASAVTPSRGANVVLSAATSTADVVGSKLTVKLTDLDTSTLRGSIRIPARCGDFAARPSTARVPPTRTGGTSSVTFTVSAASGSQSTVCLAIGATTYRQAVVVPPPVEHVVYDFESDAQGWVPANGTSSVARVTTFANGPQAPHGGTGALEATTPAAPADTSRVASVTPASPLDLGSAKSVVLWMDAYGGAPDATGYLATVTITASDGSTVTGKDSTFTTDQWNQVSVDVGSWAGRSSIAKIEVSFAAVGSSYPTWNPRFQVDDVGYFTS